MSGRKFLIGFYIGFYHVNELLLFNRRQFIDQFIEDYTIYLRFVCQLILQEFICRNI